MLLAVIDFQRDEQREKIYNLPVMEEFGRVKGVRREWLISALLASGMSCALVSCGSSSGSSGEAEGAATEAPTQSEARVKSGELFDDDSGKMLGRYGAANPMFQGRGNQSASEGGKPMDLYRKELSQREFKTPNYEKKAFWGTKEYQKKVYGGNLDGSRFLQEAREGAMTARQQGQMAHNSNLQYGTNEMHVSSAREAGKDGIRSNSDAQTDFRRRVFVEPEVKQTGSNRSMTVDDVRQMLGR